MDGKKTQDKEIIGNDVLSSHGIEKKRKKDGAMKRKRNMKNG